MRICMRHIRHGLLRHGGRRCPRRGVATLVMHSAVGGSIRGCACSRRGGPRWRRRNRCRGRGRRGVCRSANCRLRQSPCLWLPGRCPLIVYGLRHGVTHSARAARVGGTSMLRGIGTMGGCCTWHCTSALGCCIAVVRILGNQPRLLRHHLLRRAPLRFARGARAVAGRTRVVQARIGFRVHVMVFCRVIKHVAVHQRGVAQVVRHKAAAPGQCGERRQHAGRHKVGQTAHDDICHDLHPHRHPQRFSGNAKAHCSSA